jgi:hypothetical protein
MNHDFLKVNCPDRPTASAADLSLHPLILRRVDRYRQFYASNRPGDLLIVIRPRWVKKKNLFEYDFEHGGHLAMAADMLASAQAMLAEGGDRDDDLIPWLSPDLGIAIHHTFFVDLPVTFAEWTSWADHPLAGENGYARLPELRFDPANRWVRRNREMLEFWQAHNDGSCLLNTHMHFGPLDLANALRGNALFTDFYDYPDEVAALLDLCTEAINKRSNSRSRSCSRCFTQVGSAARLFSSSGSSATWYNSSRSPVLKANFQPSLRIIAARPHMTYSMNQNQLSRSQRSRLYAS